MGIRVILADDHPVLRKGIRDYLAATQDIIVVAEAVNGHEAVSLVESFKPDVLLLDMGLPGINGVEVTRKLKALGNAVHVLAFSAYDDWEFIFGTLNEGAAGYLTKDESMEDVTAAIRGVANNQQGWLSRTIKGKLMLNYQGVSVEGVRITPRQELICKQISEGKTNRQIAYSLKVSEKTVEKYLENLFHKFDVVSRVQLAVITARESKAQASFTSGQSLYADREYNSR